MKMAAVCARVAHLVVQCAFLFCVGGLLTGVLSAQCTSVSQVPNQTISSGTACYSNSSTLTAAGVTINGSANVSFAGGQTVHLTNGFHATAPTSGAPSTTFHAWVDPAPSNVSVSPASGSGLTQSFTFAVSSPAGYGNLMEAQLLINSALNGVDGCYIRYNANANALYLLDNSGSTWQGGFAPGSSGNASNSYCSISGAGASVTKSGTQLSVTVPVTFQSVFAGAKNEYVIAIDDEGMYSGWQTMGAWTVPGTPVGPDFSLGPQLTIADSPWISSNTLTTVPWNLTVTPLNGFTSPVSFSMTHFQDCSDPPLFSPAQVSGAPWKTTVSESCNVQHGNTLWQYAYASSVITPGNTKTHTVTLYLNVTDKFYHLTTVVNPPGAGTLSPAGGSYGNGALVAITATANAGYKFQSFTGIDSGSGSTGNVWMNGDRTVTANFTQTGTPSSSLTTIVSPSGGGTVTPSCPGGCSYSNGSQVMLTATPASGYQFTGFTGPVTSSSSSLTVTINGAITETANFTAVTNNPPLTVAPSSQQVAPTGVAGYSVTAGASAGFSGTVTFSASGLPAGASATFNPATINSSGSVFFNVVTSSASPAGTFPIVVTAQSAGLTRTAVAMLTIAAPSPANMISPGNGAILSGTSATFSWDPGVGAAEYQLALGSTPGAANLQFQNTGTGRNATVNLSGMPATVYATLGSLISGTWQSRSYSYRMSSSPPQVQATAAIVNPQAPPTNYYVYNDNNPVTLSYCIVNPDTQKCDDDRYDAGRLLNCSVSGNGVSARLAAVGTSSVSGHPYEYDVEFKADRTATPGSRNLTCKWPSIANPGTSVDIVVTGAVTIYDATPRITYLNQDPPAYAGGPFYVEIYGQNFGFSTGSLAICVTGATPCNGTPDFTVDLHAPYSFWSDNQVNALLTPSPNAVGVYDVQIVSRGANGASFAPAPQGQTSSQSNSAQVIQPPTIVLHVTWNGQEVHPGDTIYVPFNGQPFTLGAYLTGPGLSGTVVWGVSAEYKDPGDMSNPYTKQSGPPYYVESYPSPNGTSSPVPVQTPWSISLSTGGKLTVRWSLNGGATVSNFSFNIRGSNPFLNDVLDYLGTDPWYFWRIASHESEHVENGQTVRFEQFKADGTPLFGAPHGYGIMKLDPTAGAFTAGGIV